MIWQDVLVQFPLSDNVLIRGLATGFGVNPHEVLIHRGADGFPEPGCAKVVCVVSERAEGFRSLMSLYTYFDSPCEDDPVAVLKRFAKEAQVECLMTDDSPDPYTMIRVLPTGNCVKAKLDVARLDDMDEYHIME